MCISLFVSHYIIFLNYFVSFQSKDYILIWKSNMYDLHFFLFKIFKLCLFSRFQQKVLCIIILKYIPIYIYFVRSRLIEFFVQNKIQTKKWFKAIKGNCSFVYQLLNNKTNGGFIAQNLWFIKNFNIKKLSGEILILKLS